MVVQLRPHTNILTIRGLCCLRCSDGKSLLRIARTCLLSSTSVNSTTSEAAAAAAPSAVVRLHKDDIVYPKRPPRKYTALQAIERLNERAAAKKQSSAASSNHNNYTFAYTLSVKLNLHRVSGNKLLDMLVLPHGTGKQNVVVAALTRNPELAQAARKAGAVYTGDLAHDIATKVLQPKSFHRVICIKEEMEDQCRVRTSPFRQALEVCRKIPSVEDRTLVNLADFLAAVRNHAHGKYVKLKTSCTSGTSRNIASIIVGQYDTHTPQQVLENLRSVLQSLYDIRKQQQAIAASKPKRPRYKKKQTRKQKKLHKQAKLEIAKKGFVESMHLGMMGVRSYPLNLAKVLDFIDKSER